MKRLTYILLTLCAALPLHAGVHKYASGSVLASGNFVKIQVSKSGIHSISYEEIKSLGLDPAKTGVLGYGGALLNQNFSLYKTDDLPPVAIHMETGSDGVFGSGDYILFYAQGPVDWQYSNGNYEHTRNHYSDYGYYFLSDADGAQKLMETGDALPAENTLRVTDYTDYRLHEKEVLNLIDAAKGAAGGGRDFYGEQTNAGSSLSVSFDLPHANTARPSRCKAAVAAAAISKNQTLTLISGGAGSQHKLNAIEQNDFYTKAIPATCRLTEIPTSRNTTVTLRYTSDIKSDRLYLDYIELTAYSRLQMDGDELAFRYADNIGNSANNLYMLTGCDASTQIWNISRKDSIVRMPSFRRGDTLCFVGTNKQAEEYIAVRTKGSAWQKPTVKGKTANQNLHGLPQTDLVIVTPAEWKDEALRLGEAHRQKDGTSYAVVTDEEVYNEFSSGTPDASAIRWLMKMLYDRAGDDEQKRPKSLLLFGDGTFDNRKLLATSGNNTLITYQAFNSTGETQAYATDDYFAFLEDKDGMAGNMFFDTYGVMRIGVGRLPVNTKEEARQVTDKLTAFIEDNNKGAWKQQLCFLADDGDHNQHTQITDHAAENVRLKAPDFVTNKIYLDAYPQVKTASSESYPLAYNRYTNLLRTGVLLMDYTGHGGPNNICNEMFLTLNSVEQMTNRNQGFWMLATCSYAHFDQAATSSAEAAVLNPKGGAIGVLSACRTVYATDNDILNNYFCDTLMGHKDAFTYPMTLGEAARIAKNRTGRKENKLPYILLGDPALRLNYPTQHQVVTTAAEDTIRALSEVTIGGEIRTAAGTRAETFNGTVHVSVYDKLQQTTTRDNDELNPDYKRTFTYNDYPNLLFSGSTAVTEGRFSISFRIPKDIRYNYGNGRIVYYALDNESGEEAVGHDHGIIIGGSDNKAVLLNDTTGPELTVYLDNPSFRSGDKTSEKPHFYANVYDENGINTVGSGIGHDLTLVLDDDPKQTYSLNDYFTAHNGSYKEGTVSYTFPELAEGGHRLMFRAWDLLNNSSSSALDFTVVKGLSPVLYSVTIAPNPCPAAQTASITISTDRPDEMLESEISIYSLNGERIFCRTWTEDRTLLFTPTELNMKGGIYIIRINCKTDASGTSTATGKLVVL